MKKNIILLTILFLLIGCSQKEKNPVGPEDSPPSEPGDLTSPMNVSASDGTYTDTVAITWSPVEGATEYYIYKANHPSFTFVKIDTTSATTYHDLAEKGGAYKYYKVSSYNKKQGESGLSDYNQGYYTKFIFITQWGSEGSADGQFLNPRGIDVDSSGNVYVADKDNHRIQKFDSSGNFLENWNFGDVVLDIEFDHVDNALVLGGSGGSWVKWCNSSGTIITQWGTSGTNDNQFGSPRSIAVDSSGYVYITDYNHFDIKKFTYNGSFIKKWDVYEPLGLAIDNSDIIYCFSTGGYIKKYTSSGVLLDTLGFPGGADGQFQNANGLRISPNGTIYVADTGKDRIQEVAIDGTFITKHQFANPALGQFNWPRDIAADSSGNVYVIDDNHHVLKFQKVP